MTDPEPGFGELSRETVERSNEVVFLVDPGLRITYCNPAWDKFALANRGEQVVAARVIGTDLMRVIPESLRDLYSGLFQRCRQQHLTFDFDYECSSAEGYRLLHMNIFPLNNLRVVQKARHEVHIGFGLLQGRRAADGAHHCRRSNSAALRRSAIYRLNPSCRRVGRCCRLRRRTGSAQWRALCCLRAGQRWKASAPDAGRDRLDTPAAWNP